MRAVFDSQVNRVPTTGVSTPEGAASSDESEASKHEPGGGDAPLIGALSTTGGRGGRARKRSVDFGETETVKFRS